MLIYGVVIYLYNEDTHKMSFLLAKNRIIGKNLNDKSIPNLEFQALTFGTEVLADTRNELAGDACVAPLNISKCILYTDSLVCLGWINSHAVKLEKSSKSAFIKNRLALLTRYCSKCPVEFRFCNGADNPADCVTRELSYKQLIKSSFFIRTEGVAGTGQWIFN